MTRRRYQDSHPWISFQLDLNQASPHFWMLLGEARSKCDHIRFVPLSAETARRLSLVYLAKGVNATTAIEGNTLSQEQVEERMRGQLELPVSQEYLGVEIDNMAAAYNNIADAAQRGEQIPLGVETLSQLNKQILAGLELEDHVVPGQTRECSVAAGTYLGPPPEDVDHLLGRLCEWLENSSFEPPNEQQRIPYAFIKAVVAHVYIEWVHPFGDGNGRLGRLVEFLILISSGVPLPAAHVLTSHYNDTRREYYRQLNNASRNGGDLRPFLLYAAQGFVDGLTEAIKQLHAQQEQLMWQALVDDALGDRHTSTAHRQRLLAVELGRSSGLTRRPVIRRLTPELTEAYLNKTNKTLTRDINRLAKLNLVAVIPGQGVQARLDRVRGMRPFVIGG